MIQNSEIETKKDGYRYGRRKSIAFWCETLFSYYQHSFTSGELKYKNSLTETEAERRSSAKCSKQFHSVKLH
jgi:hypothetical protein